MAITQTFLLAGVTSYANPGDWNNNNNVVQCIGPGGSGSLRRTTSTGGFGGGGGAHAADADIAPTFPVATTISAGGSGAKTSFGTLVIADFGKNATTTAGGAGGSVAGSTGTAAYVFAGGAATYAGSGSPGGGGAGAAGPHGAGQAAATTGGSAANGTTAPNPTASVAAGVAGRVGTQWDASHGAGSGAGGATLTGAATGIGLVGGAFGGGGSGCHSGYTGATLGAGGNGLIAITRDDFALRNHLANSAFAGAVVGGTNIGAVNSILVNGTLMSATVTAIGKDTNGLPMITVHIVGGGGTSTRTDLYFTSQSPGSGTAITPSVPYNLSVYSRLAAGATTNITSIAFQGNSHNGSTYLSTTPNTNVLVGLSGTIARATSTAVLPATATNSLVAYSLQWAAGAAIDITLEISGAQFELGDTASAVTLTGAPLFVIPDFARLPPTLPPISAALAASSGAVTPIQTAPPAWSIDWQPAFPDLYLQSRMPTAAVPTETHPIIGFPELSIAWDVPFRDPYLVARLPTAAYPTETHPIVPPVLGIIQWYAQLSTPPVYLAPRALPIGVSSPAFFPGFLPIVPPAPAFGYYTLFGNPPPPLPSRAVYMPPATGPPPNYAFDRWFQEALSEPPAYLRRPSLNTAIQQFHVEPITAALPAAPLISNIHPGLAGWTPGSYVLGQRFSSGGNAYQCIQAGNSTVPPVGTGSFIQSVPASGFSSGFSSGWGNPADTAAFKWLSHIDYTNLQAWANDLMANYSGGLPAPVTALVWNDSTLTTALNATAFFYQGIQNNGVPTLITCAPGESFRDSSGNPLAFDATKGVAFVAPTVGAELNAIPFFYIDVANVTIDGFQFRDLNQTGNTANSSANASIMLALNTNASNFTIQNSILDGFSLLYTTASNTWLKNCLLITELAQQNTTGRLWPVKWDFAGTGGAINCTCIGFNPTGTCSIFTTLGGIGQVQIINTAAFGIPNPFFCQNTGGSIVIDHSATDLSSVTADGATSGSLTNVFGNSALSGASAGTPGTLWTGADATTQAGGLAFQVVNTGTDGTTGNTFVDLRMHGTGTGVDCNIYLSGLGGTATQPSTNYTMSIGLAVLAAGTGLTNLAGVALTSNNLDSGGGFISGAVFDGLSLTGSVQTFTTSFATTGANAFNSFGIDLETPANGQPVDITLRIELPQLLTAAGGGNVVGLSIGNQFISPTNDFRLKAISGLIDRARADAADLLSQQDIYRTPRPQGLGWDIGAFEFIYSLTWLGAQPQPSLRDAGLPVALRTQEPPFISIQRAEVVSLDRYYQPLSRLIPPKQGLAAHLQQALTLPTAQFIESTTVTRWLATYPAIVRGLMVHPSLVPSHVEPVSPIFVQDVSRLQWNASWPRSVFRPSLHPSQIPFRTFQPVSLVFRETTSVDRWYQSLSVPQLWRVYYREQAPPIEPFVPIKIIPVALTVSPLVGGVVIRGFGPLIKRSPGS